MIRTHNLWILRPELYQRPTWQVSLKFVHNRKCPIICKVAVCTEFLPFKVLGALAKTSFRQIKFLSTDN